MLLNIKRLYLDRDVKGVSVPGLTYGLGYAIFWCYFCFTLHQPFACIAGIVYSTLNAIWIGMMFYFKYKSKTSTS